MELPDFDPIPWAEQEKLEVVGQRVPRVDAHEKTTGRARYTADVQRPRMAHAVLVRATIPRGRVVRIDATAARALPGVLGVITSADVAGHLKAGAAKLFDAAIHYAGQPIAAVCAERESIARAAAVLVTVEYEAAPFAVSFDAAVAAGAPPVRTGKARNLSPESPIVSQRGDAEAGLRAADVTITREYRTPVALHTALEPHGAVVEWNDDHVTVWESTQGIFKTRTHVSSAFGLPLTQVRVIKDYMGGGFGAKNGAGSHTYAAALLARQFGRAVRCVNDREGEQTDAGNRPATVQRVTLGATRDGRLTAIILDAAIPLGVSGWEGGPAKIYHELYSCPNVRTTETFAYVNAAAMSAFRGPGHVEGAFGLERAMDTLARELGIDPIDLRLRNFAEKDEEKDRPWSANNLKRCYQEGAARFGWVVRGARGEGRGEKRAEDGETSNAARHSSALAPLPSVRRGTGMAAQCWGAGGGPPAYALVRLNPDGSADVITGTQDLGTGPRTIFAQVAAEVLGYPVARVRCVIGDTERTPYTGNSWGSMTTPSVAPAVRMAAEDARRQLLDAAAQVLNVDAATLEIHAGVVRAQRGDQSIAVADLGKRLGDVMIIGRGSRGPNPENTAIHTFGVQFAEVEVDVDTGIVRVLRIVAAHDAGRILNPTLAESQMEGAIIQGVGYALFEERVMDARFGLQLNPEMHDYKIPTMADVPEIDAFCVDTVDIVANHVGARGLAEPPIIPTAPAIANAVADALGVEVNEIPLTPWRVLSAIAG